MYSTLKSNLKKKTKIWYRRAYANNGGIQTIIITPCRRQHLCMYLYVDYFPSTYHGPEKAVRFIFTSTMANYEDLEYFELGVILHKWEMGHSVSEVAIKFGISSTTISGMYREHMVSVKTLDLLHWYCRKSILKDRPSTADENP